VEVTAAVILLGFWDKNVSYDGCMTDLFLMGFSIVV
jgi:hypothetical protein